MENGSFGSRFFYEKFSGVSDAYLLRCQRLYCQVKGNMPRKVIGGCLGICAPAFAFERLFALSDKHRLLIPIQSEDVIADVFKTWRLL